MRHCLVQSHKRSRRIRWYSVALTLLVLLSLSAEILSELADITYDYTNVASARLPPLSTSTSEPQAVGSIDLVNGKTVFHLLGTDSLGRDVLIRLAMGTRVTLMVAFGAALVAFLLGTWVGLWLGYRGGLADRIGSSILDVLQALPFLVIVILLTAAVGSWSDDASNTIPRWMSAGLLVTALGGVQWFSLARHARGQACALRSAPFVVTARAMGYPTFRVIFLHVLPGAWPSITSYTLLMIPSLILEEAFLSFLGFGIQPPVPSVGVMLQDGVAFAVTAPHLLLAPALVLMLLTASLFAWSDAATMAKAETAAEGQ